MIEEYEGEDAAEGSGSAEAAAADETWGSLPFICSSGIIFSIFILCTERIDAEGIFNSNACFYLLFEQSEHAFCCRLDYASYNVKGIIWNWYKFRWNL